MSLYQDCTGPQNCGVLDLVPFILFQMLAPVSNMQNRNFNSFNRKNIHLFRFKKIKKKEQSQTEYAYHTFLEELAKPFDN